MIDPSLAGSLTVLVQTSTLKARPESRCQRSVLAGVSSDTHKHVMVSTLQEHGVDQLYYLETAPLNTDADAVVYLVRPRVELMPGVAAQVRTLARRTRQDAGLPPSGSGGGQEDSPWPPEQRCVFVPRRTLVCDKMLEEESVLGDVALCEVALQWLPLERDFLTLASVETRTSLHDAVVTGDAATGIHALAKALHALQRSVTGTVPLVRGKGPAARQVADLLLRLRKEEYAASGGAGDGGGAAGLASSASGAVMPPPPGYSSPFAVVLLDRCVDWVTPMCTPLTYEGLIDEVLGIVNGVVTVPADSEATKSAAGAAGRKTRLDSRDALFAELRDANFGAACDALRAKTAALAQDYRSIKGSDAAGGNAGGGGGGGGGSGAPQVRELGGFVKRLRDNMGGAGVDLHATLAKALLDRTKTRPFMARLALERGLIEGGKEGIDGALEAVEALCMKGAPVEDALRLWSLLALTTGGGGTGNIPPKKWESLRREFIHAYGARHVASLQHCVLAGLLPSSATGMPQAAPTFSAGFPTSRAPLQLVVDAPEMEANDGVPAPPGDIAFTHSHSGYAPLSVRLAALAARPQGWRAERAVEEALKQLPGPTFELAQGVDERGAPAELPVDSATVQTTWQAACAACSPGKSPPVLVVFIGGVARTEVAALRWLSGQTHLPGGRAPSFVTLATSVLSARAVMAALTADNAAQNAETEAVR